MRVLIIEDEKLMAAGLTNGLEADGYAVDLADNGLDGLWRAREFVYDAIILDIMLPGLSGSEICRTLRDEHIWTPILFLTARVAIDDEVSSLNAGGDDFLTKPFAYAVLLARLRALIRRDPCPRPPLLSCGDLQLDPAERRVDVRGGQLSLTATEFSMLEYLLRSTDRVVSKTDILNHVWTTDFLGDPNIVEVYIRRLRLKIGTSVGAPRIKTVRGAGYRIVQENA